MKNLLNQVWLLVALVPFQASCECLKALRVDTSSNRSITLTWDYTCTDQANFVTYKVYYEHKEWKACLSGKKDTSKGAGRGNLEVQDETSVQIPNLHPYSVYKLSVKALPDYKIQRSTFQIPEELERVAETLQGYPGVIPTASSINTKIGATSLKFYWNHPLESQCERYNAKLDGFFTILKGIEVWNQGERYEGSTTEIAETFDNLQPFSNYILFVYARTMEGKHNSDLPFKIPAETQASEQAGIPREFKVSKSPQDSTFHLTWLPPYPPTGIVSHYSVRWRQVQSEVWLGPLRVEPNSDVCANDDQSHFSQNEYERKICFSILESQINGFDNVTFQVAAYNAGSSVSGEWSAPVTPVISDDNGMSIGVLVIIVIVSIVALIIIILAVTITVNKCTQRRKQRNRYLNVPVYAPTSSSNNGPIILNNGDNRQSMPPPWTPPLQRPRQQSNSSRYQHLLLPVNNSRPGSIQEKPLPPLPQKLQDPVYEELSQATLLRAKQDSLTLEKMQEPSTSVRVSFNAVNEDANNGSNTEDEDFLKPTTHSTDDDDEDGYLQPKKLAASKDHSDKDDDEEEYLKPTFNQFTRINSRDLSPPSETPPPIPIQSYSPVRKLSS